MSEPKTISFAKPDRWVILGGGQLFVDLLGLLKDGGEDVLAVTSPRHAGDAVRGKAGAMPLRQALRGIGVPCHVSQDVNRDKKILSSITPRSVGISIGAAWIFSPAFIDRFAGRLLNIHGTRLPRNRGGGGFSWSIMQGDRLGAATLHQVEPGIDTGWIVKVREFVYPPSCRTPADHRTHYVAQAIQLLTDFIADMRAGKTLELRPQDEAVSTYWPRLSSGEQGFVDWSWGLKHIESFICAFDDPYPGASTFVNGRKVFLRRAAVDSHDGAFHPFQQGLVYRKTKNECFVAATEGSLVISDVRDEKGKPCLDAVRVGDRFYTPFEHLEKARMFRAVYTPAGLKKTAAAVKRASSKRTRKR